MQKLRKTDRRRRFLLPRVRREGGRARRADPKRYARVYCKNCGREVAANATLCPNCGAKIEPQNKKPINALGIAGFVLSLISLWGGSVFVVPIVGLILSAIGVAQRESTHRTALRRRGSSSASSRSSSGHSWSRSSLRASSRDFSTPSSTPFTPRALPPFDKI